MSRSRSLILTFSFPQVGWLAASVLMMKTQVGLGVLSLPATFHTLGMVPGVIILVSIAAIWTCEFLADFSRLAFTFERLGGN